MDDLESAALVLLPKVVGRGYQLCIRHFIPHHFGLFQLKTGDYYADEHREGSIREAAVKQLLVDHHQSMFAFSPRKAFMPCLRTNSLTRR